MIQNAIKKMKKIYHFVFAGLLIFLVLLVIVEICLYIKYFYICPNEELWQKFGVDSLDCRGESYDVGLGFMGLIGCWIVGDLVLLGVMRLKKTK